MNPPRPIRTILLCCLAYILGLLIAIPLFGQSPAVTIKIPYKSKNYIGKPLAWDGRDLMLLRRDGRISYLPVQSQQDYEKISDQFRPWPAATLREKLQREFGRKYQVSMTPHFVVVHPPGDYLVWAMPFEKLFLRFNAYFKSRNLQMAEPEFPLVAVVLRSRGEFDKFLTTFQTELQPGGSNIRGYYSPRSNRIITYDQSGGGRPRDQDWFFNADTMIHEATHQTAFNTGLHNRFTIVPRWISEGLAMLFEAPGINNSQHYSRQSDRINPSRLAELQGFYATGRVSGTIAELMTRDDLFRTDPPLAYAVSWGLTFYLSEKMPKEYHSFLAADSQRKNHSQYSENERATAFATAFGANIADLEARVKRFFETL